MTFLAASASAFGNAHAVLVVLLASLVLLALRATCLTMGVALTRQVLHLLDGAIAVLFVAFFVLASIRFVTIG